MKPFFVKLFVFSLILMLVYALEFYLWPSMTKNEAYAMMVSISSDGKYAISTHINRFAILWDLKQHRYKIISRSANIYSAYFIKHSDNFIWQNNYNHKVYVENIQGKILKILHPGFATYGEVLSTDLNHYFAVDEESALFEIDQGQLKELLYYCGDNSSPPPKIPKGTLTECGGNLSRLFHLKLSDDDHYLLATSGAGEIYFWAVDPAHLLKYLASFNSAAIADFIPHSHTIVAADDSAEGLYYDPAQGDSNVFLYKTPNSQHIPDFEVDEGEGPGPKRPLSLNFIETGKFLMTFMVDPVALNYAALYDLNEMQPTDRSDAPAYETELNPLKYFSLLPQPNPQEVYPLTLDPTRAQVIDASPEAHVLVMGEDAHNGILVYHYDPVTATLENTAVLIIPS